MLFHFKKYRKNNLKNRSLPIYYYISSYYIKLTGMSLGCFTNYQSQSDIEINPCPKSNVLSWCFSICHQNLNSISAHMFAKVPFLSACISVHKSDTVSLCGTYLNSEFPSNDENLEIAGQNIVKKDHSSNIKGGGVCGYYKSSLLFRLNNMKYLQESISFELRVGGKCYKFSSLYRSPGQTQDEFKLS